MSQDNIAVAQSFYAAMGRGDIAAGFGVMDENMEWIESDNFIYADKSPYIGPNAILNGVFLRFVAEWEGFHPEIDRIVGTGETVVAIGRYVGTYRDTGKAVNAQLAHIFTVRNGKLVRFEQVTDTAQFRDAVTK